MRLTPPATATWVIALVVGILGILIHQDVVQVKLGFDAFWLVVIGFALLAIAPLVRGI